MSAETVSALLPCPNIAASAIGVAGMSSGMEARTEALKTLGLPALTGLEKGMHKRQPVGWKRIYCAAMNTPVARSRESQDA